MDLNYNQLKDFFMRTIDYLPFQTLEPSRIVMLYFCISGLDLINELESSISEEKKNDIIEWVYELQVVNENDGVAGFACAPTLCLQYPHRYEKSNKCTHLATTYAALCVLTILGDDLRRVKKDSILKSLRQLQLENGCFKGAKEGLESDMRFVYCAACISFFLNDWTGFKISNAVEFIRQSISYDCGIGQGPGLESHSGSTFCAIATLSLTNQLDSLSKAQLEGVKRWLYNRFQATPDPHDCSIGSAGRPNKDLDSCYTFWTGGALKILDQSYPEMVNVRALRQFIVSLQDIYGGIRNSGSALPDPLHSYLGIAGISLFQRNINTLDGMDTTKRILPVYPELNISVRAFEQLKTVHRMWT